MEFETEHTPPLDTHRTVADVIVHRTAPGFSGLLRAFSPAERLLLYSLSLLLGISAFVLLANVNEAVSTEVPTQGGSLSEGAVGMPRFINPLLAISGTDQDLTMLLYSGLLRAKADGEYAPDIAESYEISEDGTMYTFHLRPNLTFHDGERLTSDDVLFTIALAQNPEIKSPRRADWEGVVVAAPDEHTVVFTLPHAYAPFRENATLGIVPKHLWQDILAEEFPFSSLNTHPVGSGPYRLLDVTLDTTGAPSEYSLAAFARFALGEPNVTRLDYRVFQNTEELILAFEEGDIESFVADSPKSLARGIQESADLQRLNLARVFAVFLNQNHAPSLSDASARAALSAAVDKEAIIEKVLGGFGVVLDGPIPPGLLGQESARLPAAGTPVERGGSAGQATQAGSASIPGDHIEEARDILARGGWKWTAASSTALGSPLSGESGKWTKKKQTLSLSLATADTEELAATAHEIAAAWIAAGIPTTVQVYPLSEFNQNVLRPRSYDAILFGEVVGRSLDLFAFWHSSQRNDPGLNLALYTSAAADKTLASARAENDLGKREMFLREFLVSVDTDTPAIFLYSPELAYIVPSRLRGIETGTLTSPSDRFIAVHTWYRDTERVWNVFSN